MSTISSQAPSSNLVSSQEQSKAQKYLNSTRDDLVLAVTGLTDPQWHFKPAPDSWSIAETLEHIVIIEARVHSIIAGIGKAPAEEPGRIASEMDEIIPVEIPRRSAKFQAPPQACPSGECSPADSLRRFLDNRAQTLHLLATAPALRGHVIPHPVLGPWDGYQWILAAAAHGERHRRQILEVKSNPDFPPTGN